MRKLLSLLSLIAMCVHTLGILELVLGALHLLRIIILPYPEQMEVVVAFTSWTLVLESMARHSPFDRHASFLCAADLFRFKISSAFCGIFFAQSIVILISGVAFEWFRENFLVFESMYLILDLLSLGVVLYITRSTLSAISAHKQVRKHIAVPLFLC